MEGFGSFSSSLGVNSMLSKATQALEDAKKVAEEKANALQTSNAFSQLESMMAATPGQVVADLREKAELSSSNPLGSLDFDLVTPAKRATARVRCCMVVLEGREVLGKGERGYIRAELRWWTLLSVLRKGAGCNEQAHSR